MSFHEHAEDIRIEDDHILIARLADAEGELQDASVDLNELLGNSEGTLNYVRPAVLARANL